MDELEQLIRGGQPSTKKDYSNLVTEDLLDRLRKVESGKDDFAVNKQTKALGAYQFMPETVADMHRKGKKFNPFDEKEARQAAKEYLIDLVNRNNGDLDKALANYGGFVTKDPSQYVSKVKGDGKPSAPVDELEQLIRGTPTQQAPAKPEPVKPQGVSEADMSKPFIGFPSAKKPTAQKPSEANVQPMRELGQSFASLADQPINMLTGALDYAAYPLARAYYGFKMSPEEAAAKAMAETTSPKNIIGRALGIEQTPGYQAEVTRAVPRAIMETDAAKYIAANVSQGIDALSAKTGLPKADVESIIQSLGIAATPAVTKGLEATAKGAKSVVGTIQEARELAQPRQKPTVTTAVEPQQMTPQQVSDLQAYFEQRKSQPSSMVSMGSAVAPNETTIKAALTQVTPDLRDALKDVPVNKMNMPVFQRHIEANTLDVPINLMKGQATQDPIIISQEMNKRSKPGYEGYINRLNEQNQQLIENLNVRREKAAPDVFGTRPIEFGESIIDAYKQKNKLLEDDINAKYTALRDAAGGQFPVDAPQLLKNVETTLRKELLTNDAKQISQFKELQRLAKDNSMTFEDFLSLRKNLGNVARTAQDGNVRMAASRMIDELEKLPLSKQAQNLKPLADEARKAARERFQMLSKDPAFKAAVEDTVPADKFAQKFVITGINKNVKQMIDNLGSDSVAHQNMKAAVINHLKEKAGIIDDKGNFSQKEYNKALRNLDNMNNLNIIMDGESAQKLKSLGNVAAYIQNQPKGSFVNNSNSAVAFLADKAASALETAGNVMLGGKYGIPAGSIVRGKVQEVKARKEAEQSLRPGAGVELRNIGKEEK